MSAPEPPEPEPPVPDSAVFDLAVPVLTVPVLAVPVLPLPVPFTPYTHDLHKDQSPAPVTVRISARLQVTSVVAVTVVVLVI